jgi:hypothetical protein
MNRTLESLGTTETVLIGSLLDHMRKDTLSPDGPATNALWALLEFLNQEDDLDAEDRAGVHAVLVDYAEQWAAWGDA